MTPRMTHGKMDAEPQRSRPLEPRTILVRAVVHTDQSGALTCTLEDGFGRAQVLIHESAAIVEAFVR